MLFEVVALCALCAGDWPQFRGPTSDGHAIGAVTPLEWSDSQNCAQQERADLLSGQFVVWAQLPQIDAAFAFGRCCYGGNS